MISRVRSQAADVGSNVQVGVPTATLWGGGKSVAGRGAVLEVNSRGQPMRIE